MTAAGMTMLRLTGARLWVRLLGAAWTTVPKRPAGLISRTTTITRKMTVLEAWG